MVRLNVGGERHGVVWRLLEGQPRSRLGLLASATTADQVGPGSMVFMSKKGIKWGKKLFVFLDELGHLKHKKKCDSDL